ncbi:uncharacterized protein SCHCODRAFT_02671930 [Schizophyllum commune H4-8]|uniref:uncharacterized protein n=1 Tax=Schizophyllum commune (strain H4-8 / FGSC 9210) TaxID=578458 RepID=UPI00215F2727|nr:uncharacterized protein SCHCODRAFT_02671930 [Schizophyllum commune H4-8]KAI5888015.1 hypothetical protein SCHCODRAFT_02671930 [Schizophyllum commune H4-8]
MRSPLISRLPSHPALSLLSLLNLSPPYGVPAIEESAVAVWEVDYVAAKYGMAAAQARIKKLEGEVIVYGPRGASRRTADASRGLEKAAGIEQESHKFEGEASDI